MFIKVKEKHKKTRHDKSKLYILRREINTRVDDRIQSNQPNSYNST